jgi:hypothetical protein
MSRVISEPDWRLLRELKPVALDRFCRRVLEEIAQISSDAGRSSHERYLAVYQLVERRDRELAETFNDLCRASALVRLAAMRLRGLLTEEELARFSPETRDFLRPLTGT